MIVSLEKTTVIFNGHEIQGWSEDTDSLMMPDAFELATVRRGATGDMAAFSSGDKGGPVSIKLLPNSPSTKFFMQQLTDYLEGGNTIWHGSIQNAQLGFGFTLKRGIMTTGPLGQTMGKGEVANQTFIFEFEEIVPDYDAARMGVIQGP